MQEDQSQGKRPVLLTWTAVVSKETGQSMLG